MEKAPIREVASAIASLNLSDANTTVLHVYHFNREDSKNYVVHTLRNSLTPIVLPKKTAKKGKSDTAEVEKLPETEENDGKRGVIAPSREQHWAKRFAVQAARVKVYDKAKHDPRADPVSPPPDCESYFVHLPTLWGHCPPYTLRNRGHKRAPVVCLFDPRLFWRQWKLEFGDVLTQEGVIDGRGLVNWRHGTKKGENGTLKGYKDRKRRWWLESGKKYFYEQLEHGHMIPEAAVKAKPEEVVNVKWTAPFVRAREYNFVWRGFQFAWKGTTVVDVQPKKFGWFRETMTRWNHLKLIVTVLDQGEHLQNGPSEIVLARYTSVLSARKAGRLEIFHDMLDLFLRENLTALTSTGGNIVLEKQDPATVDPFQDLGSPTEPRSEEEKTAQRLKDVVVASAMCMIMGEFQKREWVWALFWLLVDAAQNGGG
ncbi:hypothetical protein M7I_3037 [Glarea lozoyensis 74030]|nr:hypothetical protein M7I_3037 [Glarea lozoyensis 74030]